jgi:hypothetical protein
MEGLALPFRALFAFCVLVFLREDYSIHLVQNTNTHWKSPYPNIFGTGSAWTNSRGWLRWFMTMVPGSMPMLW